MNGIVRRAAKVILTLYHRVLSPFLPCACRFYPACSVYTSEAIQRHGFLKGTAMGLWRLSRCHPWNPGGYDPVP